MKRSALVALVLILGLFVGNSLAAEVTLFGPNQYVRTTGKPNVYGDTFPGIAGKGKLILKNGDADGKNRISSASIILNGWQVLGPGSFNQKVYNVEVPVNLSENNSISIELQSKPGSYITLQAVQEVQADAAAVIGPAGGVVEVSNPSSALNGASITFPSGAVEKSTIVSISQAPNIPELPVDISPDGVALKFDPEGTIFNQFFLIRLPVPVPPADDEFLAVAYYNDQTDKWQVFPIIEYDPVKGTADFVTDHFSFFIMVTVKQVPNTVSIDFNVNTDSLNFDNDNYNPFNHCPEESAGVCNGIAIYAKWYYENHGHGLKCRYGLDKAEEIACEVFKKYDQVTGWPSKLLSWFSWLGFKELAIFDWNQAAFIIDSLNKGTPTILGLWGWWGGITGHAVLVTGWTRAGDSSGYFTIYDVNDNTKTNRIYCSKNPLSGTWTFKYNMCPDDPDLGCPDYKVFTPYVDFWLDIRSVYNKYQPDNWCAPASITVDGDPSDWAGIAPILTDPAGDCIDPYYHTYIPGMDILKVYITNDNVNIYFLLEFAGSPVVSNPTGGVVLRLDTNLDLNTPCPQYGGGGSEYIMILVPGQYTELRGYTDAVSCPPGGPYGNYIPFPGAITYSTGGSFLEASVSIETLRVLSPQSNGFRILIQTVTTGNYDDTNDFVLYSFK